jgi:uncharacterized protein (DUF305 family)
VERAPFSKWKAALALAVAMLIGMGATVVGFTIERHPVTSLSSSSKPSAVDVGFAQAMSIHHGQAVLMANEAVIDATSPAVRLLAREILVEQSQEIGMMRTWLSDWNMPQLSTGPVMGWMQKDQKTRDVSMTGMASIAATGSNQMPGMATNKQLTQLAASKGIAFDRLFLQLMLRHHEGGIEMANYAEQHAQLPQVRAAAGAMIIDQTNECTLIEELLQSEP